MYNVSNELNKSYPMIVVVIELMLAVSGLALGLGVPFRRAHEGAPFLHLLLRAVFLLVPFPPNGFLLLTLQEGALPWCDG